MKTVFLLIVSSLFVIGIHAQKRVRWSYFAKEIADKTYEVHLVAEMQPGWFVYAQNQPGNSIAQATTIRFISNPLITVKGGFEEKGKLEKKKYENLGIEAFYYHGMVDFVQTVQLKQKIKTTLAGDIAFQTCNDEMCMPPDVVKFSLPLH